MSCDDTWQRRGHSSLHGCITLSIDTGKCLDVEVLTKVCHGCERISKEKDVSKKADLLERYVCKENYQGSLPTVKTEDTSSTTRKTRRPKVKPHVNYSTQSTLVMETVRLILYVVMVMWKKKGNVLTTFKSVLERLCES